MPGTKLDPPSARPASKGEPSRPFPWGTPGRSRGIVGTLLAAVTLLVYARTLGHPFLMYDDETYITQNAHVAAGLTGRGAVWAFSTFYAANWHPLTWLSHMLDVSLFGMSAGGHHLTSALFHALNVVLLFLLLERLTGFAGRSAWVAAVFGLHPLHVESVAWIAERKDLVCALFGLLTVIAYAGQARSPSTRRYLTVVVLFALALMAKPMLVTLPFVLLLLDYWPLARFRWAPRAAPQISKHSTLRLVAEKLPLIALSACSSLLTCIAQGRGDAMTGFEQIPLSARLATAVTSYVTYLEKMIWPAPLSVIYPHPAGGVPPSRAALAGLFLAAGTALCLACARRAPYVVVGWLWYLGTLVPVIGLVQVGAQAMADRYTYFPLIGPLIVIAWGVPDLAGWWRRRARAPRAKASLALVSAAILSTVVLTALTWRQLGFWSSSTALFERSIEVTSGNYLAENYLGLALAKDHNRDEAAGHFREAIRLWPAFAKAHNNLGMALAEGGARDEAIAQYREALRILPEFALAHNNLGIALAGAGRTEEAIAQFGEALRIDPQSPFAQTNLGTALVQKGDLPGAVEHLTLALLERPDDPKANYYLGMALLGLGRLDEAIARFREAVRLDPDLAPARRSLAAALGQAGRSGDSGER